MKRRSFILLSAIGSTAIIIPSLNCSSPGKPNKILAEPLLLSHICDAKTIREIGEAYRKQAFTESGEDQLLKILLTDSSGKILPQSSDSTMIRSLLDQKIKDDFERDQTVNVKGWVLSATEARQCAVFSLI